MCEIELSPSIYIKTEGSTEEIYFEMIKEITKRDDIHIKNLGGQDKAYETILDNCKDVPISDFMPEKSMNEFNINIVAVRYFVLDTENKNKKLTLRNRFKNEPSLHDTIKAYRNSIFYTSTKFELWLALHFDDCEKIKHNKCNINDYWKILTKKDKMQKNGYGFQFVNGELDGKKPNISLYKENIEKAYTLSKNIYENILQNDKDKSMKILKEFYIFSEIHLLLERLGFNYEPISLVNQPI